MGVLNWLASAGRAIQREYERRIRAASEVTEYGVGHGNDHHHESVPHHAASDHNGTHDHEGNDGAAIMNVPPGTNVRPSRRTSSHEKASG